MRRVLLSGILAVTMMALPAAANAAAFEPGVVKVDGYDWSVSVPSVDVQLSQDGERYTIRQILQMAQGMPSGFNLESVPQIDILKPESTVPVSCSGEQMRSQSPECPTFTLSPDATYMHLKTGDPIPYEQSIPMIYIARAKDLEVKISPRSKKIKSGQSVKFKAEVGNEIGDVTYTWNFGDGVHKTTSDGSITHKFTGADKTFNVLVQVTATGNSRDDSDIAMITTGKVPKKKPEKKEKPEKTDDGTDAPDDSGYVPGYDDYGDGTGTGTGTDNPSADSGSPSGQGRPKQKQEKKQTPPVDDGLETVSGELIGPGTTATVIPPSDSSGASGEEAKPAKDDSSGGGISKGAATALGIGALLGLGGMAEAGAFSGFRRFRFRP